MTYLITGATGFVGKHCIDYLVSSTNDLIIGTFRNHHDCPTNERVIYKKLDLNNIVDLIEVINKYKPQRIIHLAAESSVGFSWKFPNISFNNNVNIYLNLLEAIRHSKLVCRILSVGSSEGYGKVEKENLPLKESFSQNPVSPYAVARVSQEMISKVYIEGYGLDIVLTRSFNHIGPGQDERFVIPSFAKKIIQSKIDKSQTPIRTGDLRIVRDFIDVRDVIVAYIKLFEISNNGEVYNICSGVGTSLYEVINKICAEIGYNVKTEVNPKFIRPNDNPIIVGDNTKLQNHISWTPKISLENSIKEICAHIQEFN